MKRRIALQHMATVVGGLVTLPAWANGWSSQSLTTNSYLSAKQDALLASVVETIIPETDIPGARSLNVHTFVQKMVNDCYEEEVQQNMIKGLQVTEELARKKYSQPFNSCSADQRMEVLTQMENSADQPVADFFKLTKDLTIQGYMSSEYVLTKHMKYTMVPGHYYGCVPVVTK
ncbi:gluconate 2-dehydrogenase subunit 3 family protein [Rhodocytophaga aerolata]|uniref:Gluconate 2-dehydrogenase subunit 3 family protein n=1 Tax=Rhodocytophaga aerolata TaxID=455078 RepID=A0ABT8RE85_9BACT|nr:gluconate 2-dehydrogenase subunit 3 family protein [Rhodocytophaga aerolata]MDO1450412.1 gluconate 2-dehydrogenase subunit 3 family protein [Rhodocytophaga aerolata]